MTCLKMGIITVDDHENLSNQDLKRFTKEFIAAINGSDEAYRSDFASKYNGCKKQYELSFKYVGSQGKNTKIVESIIPLFRDMNIEFNSMMDSFLEELVD